jgi:hypothetical protein
MRRQAPAEELRHQEQTLGWTGDDAQLLRKHAALFESQAEKMVASWREIIGSQPHLAKWFFTPEGEPDDEYKAAVKCRFIQWVGQCLDRSNKRAASGNFSCVVCSKVQGEWALVCLTHNILKLHRLCYGSS